jgi:ribosomal protein S12 methylthiotransferase accessory factor
MHDHGASTKGDDVFDGLASTLGGICRPPMRIKTALGEPPFAIQIVHGRGVGTSKEAARPDRGFSGSGTALTPEAAMVPALAEFLERYSATRYDPAQFVVASARELGDEALDLDTIPRCSERELADPKCPLVAPDKTAPIRWVRGIRLRDGRMTYIPAVMVYHGLAAETVAERITLSISTGCAAYPTYEGALVRGLLEVIERDAIALVWLVRLPLPRLDVDVMPDALAACWKLGLQRVRDLQYLFFDATTDLGVPTVYALQIAPNDSRVTTLVSCAAACEPAEAVAKVVRDMAHIRVAFQRERVIPPDWWDFTHVMDGAPLMAWAAQLEAFDFLLRPNGMRRVSAMPSVDGSDDRARLRALVGTLHGVGAEAFAVDVTADEAIRRGLRVVKTIVPA